MLVDRHVKLLSRQRGSALRKVEQDIVISQTKKQKLDRPPPSPPGESRREPDSDYLSPPTALPDVDLEGGGSLPSETPRMSPVHSPELDGLPTSPANPFTSARGSDISPDLPISESPLKGTVDPFAAPIESVAPPSEPHFDFDFSELPISQLRANSLSLTSIEIISSVLHNLFEEQLIPQAYADFDTATTPADQVLYKLDIKLLSTFIHGVLADLQDTVDINLSNNELCSQVKECQRQKAQKTESLLELRHDINEWENKDDNAEHFDELRRKSALNDKLQNLIASISQEPAEPVQSPLLSFDKVSDDLIRVTDPCNGALAKLRTFNDTLEKLLE
ncbi:LADA_0A04060g1_1 [Lachancea dasiensis]|uniref:LADA_0A04060g1_1 n=1 Tax=Lachancea dasiensis TaxID=1072105 RepID=A0A1G4ING5_9SACH|nr:LADA_0A04060g1_1 [Lachancea dasiensis]